MEKGLIPSPASFQRRSLGLNGSPLGCSTSRRLLKHVIWNGGLIFYRPSTSDYCHVIHQRHRPNSIERNPSHICLMRPRLPLWGYLLIWRLTLPQKRPLVYCVLLCRLKPRPPMHETVVTVRWYVSDWCPISAEMHLKAVIQWRFPWSDQFKSEALN